MNWDQEIEIGGKGGLKVLVTVAEIQDLLMSNLTRNEMDEFGGDLIKCGVLGPSLGFL